MQIFYVYLIVFKFLQHIKPACGITLEKRLILCPPFPAVGESIRNHESLEKLLGENKAERERRLKERLEKRRQRKEQGRRGLVPG